MSIVTPGHHICESRMEWFRYEAVACFLIITPWINGVHCVRTKGAHMLLAEELLSNYGSTFSRPVYDFNQTVVVEFFMFVNQVIELNERQQTLKLSAQVELEWEDEYLSWNTSEYPGVANLNIPVSKIWKPNIHLYETVDFETPEDSVSWITPDGNVFWFIPVTFTALCRIDARFYPFDTQMCRLKFGSWNYPLSQMNFTTRLKRPISDSRQYFVENGVWDLVSVEVQRQLTVYEGYGEYPEIVYVLVLSRRSLFHVLTVLIPCALLSLINLMVFILPTESGEKVSLGITNVLALVLFQQLVAETMPPTSDNSPLISYYLTPMIVTGCLSVVSGVAVAYFYHQPPSSDVPAWVCKLIYKYLRKRRVQFHCECKITSNGNDAQEKMSAKLRAIDTDHYVVNTTEEDGDQVLEHHCGSVVNVNDRDIRVTWKDVASLIDRLLLATCVVITFVSMIVVAILFFSLR